MAAKKRGRKHPGVVLVKPQASRRTGWMAKYVDPDTGRKGCEALPRALTTAEQRTEWAVRKSRELIRRQIELETGAARKTGTSLADGFDEYFKAHPQLRPRTVELYRRATNKFEAWGKLAKVQGCDEVNLATLTRFRAFLMSEKKRAATAGGKRGQYTEGSATRSPGAINQELRSVRTALGFLLDAGYLPKLSHDDLRRGLKRLPVTFERLEFLKPAECQKLIDAALRHDAASYAETREEHRGDGEKGTTARYEPIARFVCFVLLTGMRFSEALHLDWSQVDLDALDHRGERVGEIYLRGASTKTHKPRTVGLEVSPALRAMMAAMRLEAGSPSEGRVFPLTDSVVHSAEDRLREVYGAPKTFNWQTLRRTCGTFLTNAHGIFGASSAFQSAKQLGHSVQIAEKHYVGVLRGIPRDAHTLEAAMQIEGELANVVSPRRESSNVFRLVGAAL